MATESDNVNSGALATLVAVGTFAMLGVSLVVTALVRTEMADEAQKKEVAADRPELEVDREETREEHELAGEPDDGADGNHVGAGRRAVMGRGRHCA